MEEYKSIKKVKAKPMNRLEAEANGLVRDITGIEEEGYVVEYDNNYSSWSPKEVFEQGYIKI